MGRPKVPVVCVETEEVFDSISEASRQRGVSYQGIQQAVTRRTACRGLHYRRMDEFEGWDKREGKEVPVLCVETGEVYESISEAAKAMGLNPGHISVAVSHRVGGMTWQRA